MGEGLILKKIYKFWNNLLNSSLTQFFILISFVIPIGSVGLVFLLILFSPIVIIQQLNIESLAWLINLFENNPILLYIYVFVLMSCFYLIIIKRLLYEDLKYFNEKSLRGFLIFINLISFFILGYILFYEIGFQFEFSDALVNKLREDDLITYEIFKLMTEEINENSNSFKVLELIFVTAIFPFTTIASYYTSKLINEKEFERSELFSFYKNYTEIRESKIKEYDDKFTEIEKRMKKLEKQTDSSSNKFMVVSKKIFKYIFKK